MLERRNTYRDLVGRSEGKKALGGRRRSWRIILIWIFEKLWTESISLRIGTVSHSL
jgi:hypothetical protein